ncbi:regulatory protein RecX [Microbacterium sp. A196]|uniref:regulatory protein RecX n=1 Tax=unclassified Microbacterium TaxID=2609290 RepID=UPI003FD41256
MSSAHDDGGEDRLAPVIPLFSGKMIPASELARDEASTEPRSTAMPAHSSAPGHRPPQRPEEADPDDVMRHAEEALVRKLRARSLSVSEARHVLRGQGLDAAGIDEVIDRFCERGYLDDALLAEHLVISGIERKGQGRVALSRALAQRGVPRDVIDAALGDLPDDDAERALEFARTKARSLSRLDFDTALRRLMGQLARRGYGGSVAMTAARTALAEASLGGPTTGVRFVDSD